MKQNFAPSLGLVLQHEGGKVDDPRDPGGRTAYGITQRVYDDWRGEQGLPKRDVWFIVEPEIEAIYRMLYWDAIRGDDLPSGVDYATFDFAVNSGVNRAARYLQRIVGVPDDGLIGPVTIAAVNSGLMPPCEIVAHLSCDRLAYLTQLPTFGRFGKGWTARVADVGLKAAEMSA